MADPSVEERLERLNKALSTAVGLLTAPPASWENGCEKTFADFRIACVHLRREQEALDTVQEKVEAWKFVCRSMKARPFLHDRGNEVIRILMKSDQWMQAFQDTSLSLDDLPPDLQSEFKKRADETIPEYPIGGEESKPPDPKEGGPAGPPGGSATGGGSDFIKTVRPSNLAVVVQRCSRAKVLVEERAGWWDEIGQGLVITVSFSKGAREDVIGPAARFLLTAKLSTKERWAPGGKTPGPAMGGGETADSLINLCAAGDEQGILVVPQETLCSEVEKDNVGLRYKHAAPQATAHDLYKAFVGTLRSLSSEMVGKSASAKQLKVLAASFNGHQYYEMTTSGPFTHAFHF